MQESKEISPHITTKEELDALYKNIQTSAPQNEEKQTLLDNQGE
ncbi:MAG: hypothetical protein NT085_02620 [candidate division SR1 bacterium]|nr:hypothetical protein [candidate division SR1 bacterium]